MWNTGRTFRSTFSSFEGALDRAQALVRPRPSRGQAGAHNKPSAPPRRHGLGLADSRTRISNSKCFILYLPTAHPHADLVRALQAPLLPPRGAAMGSSSASVASSSSLARPLLRQQLRHTMRRSRASDLHQVGLVEQRHPHRAGFRDRTAGPRSALIQSSPAGLIADARLGQSRGRPPAPPWRTRSGA